MGAMDLSLCLDPSATVLDEIRETVSSQREKGEARHEGTTLRGGGSVSAGQRTLLGATLQEVGDDARPDVVDEEGSEDLADEVRMGSLYSTAAFWPTLQIYTTRAALDVRLEPTPDGAMFEVGPQRQKACCANVERGNSVQRTSEASRSRRAPLRAHPLLRTGRGPDRCRRRLRDRFSAGDRGEARHAGSGRDGRRGGGVQVLDVGRHRRNRRSRRRGCAGQRA